MLLGWFENEKKITNCFSWCCNQRRWFEFCRAKTRFELYPIKYYMRALLPIQMIAMKSMHTFSCNNRKIHDSPKFLEAGRSRPPPPTTVIFFSAPRRHFSKIYKLSNFIMVVTTTGPLKSLPSEFGVRKRRPLPVFLSISNTHTHTHTARLAVLESELWQLVFQKREGKSIFTSRKAIR